MTKVGIVRNPWSFLSGRALKAAPPPSPLGLGIQGDIVAPEREPAEVMSAEDVAGLLGLDVDGVREAAGRGDIPHRRVGRRMLFSRAAITDWLRGSSVTPSMRRRS